MPESSDPNPSHPTPKLDEVIAEKQGFLHPGDSVQKAAEKMRSLQAETMPVAEGRRLVGTVDEARPDLSAAGHGHDPATSTIRETMNHKVIYCFEDEDSATALRRMDEHHLQQLPIVDRELRIVGMVRREDLQKA